MNYSVSFSNVLLKNIEKVKNRLFSVSEPIDKSKESISLIMITNIRIRDSIICYLNSMLKMKFREYLFLTDKIDSPYLKILEKLPVKIIKTRPIKSIFDINVFLNSELLDYLNTDYFIYSIVDSTIVNENTWNDEFFEYDYIGAPWSKKVMELLDGRIFYPDMHRLYPSFAVGSGGFSLRSRKLLETIRNSFKQFYNFLENSNYFEDVVICTNHRYVNYLKSKGISFAPIKLAKRFAYHFDFDDDFSDWFGIFNYSLKEFVHSLYSCDLGKLVYDVYSLYSVSCNENEVKDLVENIEVEERKWRIKDKKIVGIGRDLSLINFGYSYITRHRFRFQATNFDPILDLRKKSVSLCVISDRDPDLFLKTYLLTMKKVMFTKYYIFTSRENYSKVSFLRDKVNIVLVPKFGNIFNYSMFLLKRLWDYIDTDYVLIIQDDSCVLYQDNWYDEFLDYDYIGAPFFEYLMRGRYNDPTLVFRYPENAVGNGGFSLRSKRLLEIVAKYKNLDKIIERRGMREDVLLTGDKEILELYDKNNIKIAPARIAANFSFESSTDFFVPCPFGIHGKEIVNFSLADLDYDKLKSEFGYGSI